MADENTTRQTAHYRPPSLTLALALAKAAPILPYPTFQPS